MTGAGSWLVFFLLNPFLLAAETQRVEAGSDLSSVVPLQVTTDQRDLDGTLYIEDMLARVQRRWLTQKATAVFPVAGFDIVRSGQIARLRLERSSGVYEVDQAVLKAIESAAPFLPLPATFTRQFLGVHLVFPPHRFASRMADTLSDVLRREGLASILGLGVPKNVTKGIAAYRKAADGGDVSAMNDLAFLYEQGESVPGDRTLAVSWYRRAAERGSPVAQLHLAGMYEKGDGVDVDRAAALSLYRQAASADNPRISLAARQAITRLTR
jgi:TonB family C-terminal domain